MASFPCNALVLVLSLGSKNARGHYFRCDCMRLCRIAMRVGDRIVVGVSMNWIIWFVVWILCWSGAMFVSKTLRRIFVEIRQKTNGMDVKTIQDIKRAGRGCYFRYMVALTFNLLLLATPIVWLLIMAVIKILDL